MPNIDYSEEDLEQLLSVSSLAEYVVQMFNLHGTCRLNVIEFKDSVTCPRCIKFAEGMLEEIDQHLAVLKGYIDKLPADSSKSFILPQLFAKISSSDNQKEVFIKNVSHYTKALRMIHSSSSSLGHGDADLTRLVDTYSAITYGRCQSAKELTKCAPEKEEETPEQNASPEAPKEEKKEPQKEDISAKEEVMRASTVNAETEDNLVIIGELCSKVGGFTDRFVEIYKGIDAQKLKVISCLNQLKTFQEQGLDVSSAISPLTAQLSQLVQIQTKHVSCLERQCAALGACVSEFEEESKEAEKKRE